MIRQLLFQDMINWEYVIRNLVILVYFLSSIRFSSRTDIFFHHLKDRAKTLGKPLEQHLLQQL